MPEALPSSFWNKRYESNNTPWDLGGSPPLLTRFLKHSSPGRVLIPGCGSGYEVRTFFDHGWDVMGLDYSEAAVHRARSLLGKLGDKIVRGDFFHHDFPQPFDVIFERTFLCALPPDLWPIYIERVQKLLLPTGRLVGIFLYGKAKDPPPFPLDPMTGQKLFSPHFSLSEDTSIEDSLPIFHGNERWHVWKRTEK